MEIKEGGILIISGPRTGSTNLLKSIGSAYNKKERFEPDIVKKWPPYDSSNDVVKFVPVWAEHIGNGGDLLSNYTSFYKGVIDSTKEFNTIILLSRRNREEQLESLYVLGKYQYTVNKKWGIEKEIDKQSHYWKYITNWMYHLDIVMNNLSQDLNIPIDYCEDVYKNKTLTNKNIKLDLEYFKPKYKLRQPSMDKKIL